MLQTKSRRLKNPLLVAVILLSIILVQTLQFTAADNTTQSNPWAVDLQAQKMGQNGTSNVFAPFDQILLSANVTYNQAVQPDILVTFLIQGPGNSSNTINVTRITQTNSSGLATCQFRLPIENKNDNLLIGKWQVNATVQTTDGTLQKRLSFDTQWPVQLTAITLTNAQNPDQQVYTPGSALPIKLTINSTVQQAQTVNITFNLIDSTGTSINQTQILNQEVQGGNSTDFQASLQIPENTPYSKAVLVASISSGTYLGVDIPLAADLSTPLTIESNGTTLPTPPPSNTPIVTPTPTSTTENTIGLFAWTLIATGLFTFTISSVFLRRKIMPKIGTQMPVVTPPIINPPTTVTTTALPTTSTEIQKPSSIQLPNIVETLGLTQTQIGDERITPQQLIASYLSKISSTNEKVQLLEAELKTEKEQLNRDIQGLTDTLEKQERAVKEYFDSIRREVAKLNSSDAKKTDNKQD